jgi:hypothetical protein
MLKKVEVEVLKNGDKKYFFEPHIFEIFKVCRNKTYSFKYLLSSLGTKPRKRKPAARKASKAVLINRDIALMSASWEDFRSWF